MTRINHCELIAFILEQHQVQVTIAASAAEALAIICNAEIDLLISDVGMPEEDGYLLIQMI